MKNVPNQNSLRKLIVFVLLAMPISAFGQAANSGAQAIFLNAMLTTQLSVSVSANSVNFPLTAGSASNPGNTAITVTTSWNLSPAQTPNLTVDAYFNSSSAALSDGAGNNIPSSAFQISDNGGAYAALTNTVAFGAANAGLRLANVRVNGANKNSSRTDNLSFNINLSGVPQLPAASYTGTLFIQAQATP
jgi:hypothetical protein